MARKMSATVTQDEVRDKWISFRYLLATQNAFLLTFSHAFSVKADKNKEKWSLTDQTVTAHLFE